MIERLEIAVCWLGSAIMGTVCLLAAVSLIVPCVWFLASLLSNLNR